MSYLPLFLPVCAIGIFCQVAFSQQPKVGRPKHEVKKSIGSIVISKPKTLKASNPNWKVYSDEAMAREVGSIGAGDSVQVIGWATWLYYVRAKSIRGYVSYRALANGKELDSLAKVVETQSPLEENAELKRQQDLERGKHLKMLENKYGATSAKRIANGEYWIGMTSSMAEYSLGQPDKVNRTVTSTATQEQWVYRNLGIYLYFENGVLRSFQD